MFLDAKALGNVRVNNVLAAYQVELYGGYSARPCPSHQCKRTHRRPNDGSGCRGALQVRGGTTKGFTIRESAPRVLQCQAQLPTYMGEHMGAGAKAGICSRRMGEQ